MIEAAGLDVPLRMRVVESGLLIERVRDPRTGWAVAASELATRGELGPLDDPVPTAFDGSDWEWD